MTDLAKLFKNSFGVDYELVYAAPARINLIGEHIDYNGGLVMPAAISRYTKALVSKRKDKKIALKTTAYGGVAKKSVFHLSYDQKSGWANYAFGIFHDLLKDGYEINHGLNILIDSNIPLGSGLSSSASLLNLIGFLANDIYGFGFSLKEIALRSVKTENGYCGLKCGIMDEAAIALGEKDSALLLKCDNFDYELFKLNMGDYRFAVLQSNKKRKLTESKYNERVDECQKALQLIQKEFSDVNNLCQLKSEHLPKVESLLNDLALFKRVRHCVKENERVFAFKEAMEKGDIATAGGLLYESHLSLKEDYEVSGPHLDAIVEAAKLSGAIGARMTGAGFGGCAIALIKKDGFPSFKENVSKLYEEKMGITPDIYLVDIVGGPRKVDNL